MPGNPTVLVVDDEPDVVKSMQDLLRLQYRVLGATSAQEGLAVLAREEVHVVLTDQRMPGMTGVELLRRVFDQYPEVVRLLLTGYADVQAVIEAINVGHVQHYVNKPWNPDELMQIIRDSCAQYVRNVEEKNLRGGKNDALRELSREMICRAVGLDALCQLAADLHSRQDRRRFLGLAAGAAAAALGAVACSIYTLGENDQELLAGATVNLPPAYLNKTPVLLAQCRVDQEALASGVPVHAACRAAIRTDPRGLTSGPPREDGLASVLVAPMIWNRRGVGVIHVYMDSPCEFQESKMELLERIAAETAHGLSHARLYADELRLSNVKRAMALSAGIYTRSVPIIPLRLPGFEIATAYLPVGEWGGNYYDFINLPPHSVGLILGDIAERGVPAALFEAYIRAVLCGLYVRRRDDTPNALEDLNSTLGADLVRERFATLFFGLLDFNARRLSFANVGQSSLMLFHAGGVRCLNDGLQWAGEAAGYVFTPETLSLQPGDLVLACTDGIIGATNATDESFGAGGLRQSVLASLEEGAGTDVLVRQVLSDLKRFTGPKPKLEDATVMAIKAL